jgi:peptide/nickel transport system permease protein
MNLAGMSERHRGVRFAGRLVGSLLSLVFVVLTGGFAAAALVRYSPGFDVDENSWNPKIGDATLAAMHAQRQRDNRLPLFYAHYVAAALHGDFGQSESLRAPVSELLAERAPVSARLAGWGTAEGLMIGAWMAWLAVWPRRVLPGLLASSVNGLLLAVPPAVLALAFFFGEAPITLAVGLALAPRVSGTIRALLADVRDSPALLAARARGVGRFRLATRYVLAPLAPQWAALAGVAVVLAFGLLIPIEALCDLPGIGQLAWKAALARDLPLLSALALIITFLAASVQTVGDLMR